MHIRSYPSLIRFAFTNKNSILVLICKFWLEICINTDSSDLSISAGLTTILGVHLSVTRSMLLFAEQRTRHNRVSKRGIFRSPFGSAKVSDTFPINLHLVLFSSRPGGFQKRKYQMLDQMLNPMRKMSIDMAEFAAFKAIFFLNPGMFMLM